MRRIIRRNWEHAAKRHADKKITDKENQRTAREPLIIDNKFCGKVSATNERIYWNNY